VCIKFGNLVSEGESIHGSLVPRRFVDPLSHRSVVGSPMICKRNERTRNIFHQSVFKMTVFSLLEFSKMGNICEHILCV
jgi:hypothetical protein